MIIGIYRLSFLRKSRKRHFAFLTISIFIVFIQRLCFNSEWLFTILITLILLLILCLSFIKKQIFQVETNQEKQRITVYRTNLFGKILTQSFKPENIKKITLENRLIKRGKVDLKLSVHFKSYSFNLVSGWDE